MIKEFVDLFIKNINVIRDVYSEKHPESYLELVENVIKIISGDNISSCDRPCYKNIREIGDEDLSATWLYIITCSDYFLTKYWYVSIFQGSHSGCSALEDIQSKSKSEKPTKLQTEQYVTLSLHIVEKLKKLELNPIG